MLISALLAISHQTGSAHVPLVLSEEENVRAGAVHFVRLSRVDGLFLDSLDLQSVEFLVKHLKIKGVFLL